MARPIPALPRPSSNSFVPSARPGLCGASDFWAPAPVLELIRSLGPPWPLRRARFLSSSARPRAHQLPRPALVFPARPIPELQRPSSISTVLSACPGLWLYPCGLNRPCQMRLLPPGWVAVRARPLSVSGCASSAFAFAVFDRPRRTRVGRSQLPARSTPGTSAGPRPGESAPQPSAPFPQPCGRRQSPSAGEPAPVLCGRPSPLQPALELPSLREPRLRQRISLLLSHLRLCLRVLSPLFSLAQMPPQSIVLSTLASETTDRLGLELEDTAMSTEG